MLNFAAFHPQHNLENTVFDGPWVSTADSSEFKALFEEWEPEVRILIEVRPFRRMTTMTLCYSRDSLVCRQLVEMGHSHRQTALVIYFRASGTPR